MPRPPYSWKSFWAGLLVLAFLGGMWVRSMHYMETFAWRPGPRELAWGQAAGEVTFHWVPLRGIKGDFSVLKNRLPFSPPSTRWFAPAFHRQHENRPGFVEQRTVRIAHWLLVLSFLLPWAAFIFWRAWRVKRLTAETAALLARDDP